MTRQEYIQNLKHQLKDESYETVCQVLDYYEEMIDDLCEEGLSEEAAIETLEDVSVVVMNIKDQEPVYEIKKVGKNLQIGIIILLIIAFPLWGALLATLFALLLSLYIVVWCVPLVTVSIGLSGIICFIVGVFGTFSLISSSLPLGLLQLGIGAIAGGIGLFGFFLTKLSYQKMKVISLKMTYFIKEKSLFFLRKVGIVC